MRALIRQAYMGSLAWPLGVTDIAPGVAEVRWGLRDIQARGVVVWLPRGVVVIEEIPAESAHAQGSVLLKWVDGISGVWGLAPLGVEAKATWHALRKTLEVIITDPDADIPGLQELWTSHLGLGGLIEAWSAADIARGVGDIEEDDSAPGVGVVDL